MQQGRNEEKLQAPKEEKVSPTYVLIDRERERLGKIFEKSSVKRRREREEEEVQGWLFALSKTASD